jgi:hypothetical protein
MEKIDSLWINRICAKLGMRADMGLWAGDEALGCLDAPQFMAAGAMRQDESGSLIHAQIAERS